MTAKTTPYAWPQQASRPDRCTKRASSCPGPPCGRTLANGDRSAAPNAKSNTQLRRISSCARIAGGKMFSFATGVVQLAKASLLLSDITQVVRLLEDEASWGSDPKFLAKKILESLYNNDSDAAMAATRGIIVVRGDSDAYWAIGPYATVDAAKKAAADPAAMGLSASSVSGYRTMHLRHPWHYSNEGREASGVGRAARAA